MNAYSEPYAVTPYVRSSFSTRDHMFFVIMALLPCAGYGIYNFGPRAALLVLISVGSSVLFELLMNLILRRPNTLSDYSAVVSGLIGGLLLPPTAELYYPVISAAVAMIAVKALFGGLGRNILNPAMTGHLVLLLLFPAVMRDYHGGLYSDVTPLAELAGGNTINLQDVIFGKTSGCIGTTSAIMVLVGAAFLILVGVLDLIIPLSFLLGFLVIFVLLGSHGFDPYYVIAQMVSGSLLFTAFFMATDYTTSPMTRTGKVLYGLLLGILTAGLRILGLTENACVYALLLGNLTVRFLDRHTMPRPFGIRRARHIIRYDRQEELPVEEEMQLEYEESEDIRRESYVGEEKEQGRDTILLGLRPAVWEDAEFLLNLRNDPATRQNSFQTKEVLPEEHYAWLQRTLQREDAEIYILTSVIDGQEYRFGQLRLNYEKEAALISYGIAPDYRGHGLGKELLGLAEQAARRRSGIRMLQGEVKIGNEASLRSFRALGYAEEAREGYVLFTKQLL